MVVPVLNPVIDLVAVEIGQKQDRSADCGNDDHCLIFLTAKLGALDREEIGSRYTADDGHYEKGAKLHPA